MDLEIDLCIKFHPSGFIPDEKNAKEGRILKRKFLQRVFEKVNPAGFIAVKDGKPIGLLELMPRAYARRNGYITGINGIDNDTLTIVCLEVALGENRKEVIGKLVAHLVDNLNKFRSYRRLEVGAFPRDVEFHPSWVYEKYGFNVSEDREIVKVLTISIPQE
jgi:hypothetical protein